MRHRERRERAYEGRTSEYLRLLLAGERLGRARAARAGADCEREQGSPRRVR